MKIGQEVILICRYPNDDPDWPPIGAQGTIVRGLDEWDDYEIMFNEYPWGADDPTWEIPKGWVVPIRPTHASLEETEFLYA